MNKCEKLPAYCRKLLAVQYLEPANPEAVLDNSLRVSKMLKVQCLVHDQETFWAMIDELDEHRRKTSWLRTTNS